MGDSGTASLPENDLSGPGALALRLRASAGTLKLRTRPGWAGPWSVFGSLDLPGPSSLSAPCPVGVCLGLPLTQPCGDPSDWIRSHPAQPSKQALGPRACLAQGEPKITSESASLQTPPPAWAHREGPRGSRQGTRPGQTATCSSGAQPVTGPAQRAARLSGSREGSWGAEGRGGPALGFLRETEVSADGGRCLQVSALWSLS